MEVSRRAAVLLLVVLCSATAALSWHVHPYTMVNNKLHQVVYAYPNQARNDTGLNTCGDEGGRVCSTVHKRYWLPPLVYRECNCPQGQQCSNQWSDYNNTTSLPINNISQLKFCEDISYMEQCKNKQLGLAIEEKRSTDGRFERNMTAFCNCRWPAYWQLGVYNMNETRRYTTYYCTKLYDCQVGDFCGHIRADTYSVYYRCRCPAGSMCIRKDPTQRNASEVLYDGLMHRAYCMSIDYDNDDDNQKS